MDDNVFVRLFNDNKTNNKEIEKLRPKLRELAHKALELYNDFLNDPDHNEKDKDFKPMVWLLNQDRMRHAWNNCKIAAQKHRPIIKNMLLDNVFANYMHFMYDIYPPGFGNILLYQFISNQECDGAEIFYYLEKNSFIG